MIEGTVGENPPDGLKPKGVIHWVDSRRNTAIAVHLYERLFIHESPDMDERNFLDHINRNSLIEVEHCLGEIGLQNAEPEQGYQFEREGYFCRDNQTSALIFNRTIELRDTFNT